MTDQILNQSSPIGDSYKTIKTELKRFIAVFWFKFRIGTNIVKSINIS